MTTATTSILIILATTVAGAIWCAAVYVAHAARAHRDAKLAELVFLQWSAQRLMARDQRAKEQGETETGNGGQQDAADWWKEGK